MLDKNYLLMEVVAKRKVKFVDVCEDNVHMGFEPEAELELKEPGKFSMTKLVGTLSDKAALYPFQEGDLVAVNLKLWGHQKDGELVNDIYINDIKLVKDLDHLYL